LIIKSDGQGFVFNFKKKEKEIARSQNFATTRKRDLEGNRFFTKIAKQFRQLADLFFLFVSFAMMGRSVCTAWQWLG